ncbi:hypothetical protein H696_02784 [Fonticula alba]|uniref:Proteasome subunit beta n=1 Tax=Fonticula alba TaxID=691883 RepID=A0A058Z8K9_FONAL|nr:hypothetical protein H696_02784 [Fonticula alba]KCV70441.1 hypothetical protein H696_02784 [Fonticula alba]|eukprot:XP_009494957.1 hypothetical protein H696_02784 [Fonticula alba]
MTLASAARQPTFAPSDSGAEKPMSAPVAFSRGGTPTAHASSPIMTGAAVLALKYKDGVMIACDNHLMFGSMDKFRNVERLITVEPATIVGFSGDYADFQYIKSLLDDLVLKERTCDDGHSLSPRHVFEYLASMMYHRRNKFDPLWNTLVVAGVDTQGKSFLGQVDLRGGSYQADTVTTGFGNYLGQPLLREAVEGKIDSIDEEAAKEIMKDALKVLFYRNTQAANTVQIGVVRRPDAQAGETKPTIQIDEPITLDTEWGFAQMVVGYR